MAEPFRSVAFPRLHFPLHYLLLLLQLLLLLSPHHAAFALLLALQPFAFWFEGAKIHLILRWPAHVLFALMGPCLGGAVLLAVQTYCEFRFYSLSTGVFSGPFRVGYLHLLDRTSVMYPTLEQTQPAEWMTEPDIEQLMFQLINKDLLKQSKAPRFVVYALFNFLRRVKLHVEHRAAIAALPEYRVAVISHQLGSFENGCSVIAGFLASHGFIVVSPCYRDQIVNRFPSYSENLPFRLEQVDLRVQGLVSLVDSLPTLLINLFGRHLKLDMARLVAIGHSLGASTVLNAALQNRISGTIVALDPCAYIIRQTNLKEPKSIPRSPIFCLGTSYYYQQYPPFQNRERLLHLEELFGRDKINNVYVRRMSHCHSATITFPMIGFFDYNGTTTPREDPRLHMQIVLKLVWLAAIQGIGLDQFAARMKDPAWEGMLHRFQYKDGSLVDIPL